MGNPTDWSGVSVTDKLNRDLNIVVLMGGWSAERPVSLMSGNGVADERQRGRRRA